MKFLLGSNDELNFGELVFFTVILRSLMIVTHD